MFRIALTLCGVMLNTAPQLSSMPLATQAINVIAGNVDLVTQNERFSASPDSVNSVGSTSSKESFMSNGAEKGSKCPGTDSGACSTVSSVRSCSIEGNPTTKNTEQSPQSNKPRYKAQHPEISVSVAQPTKLPETPKDLSGKQPGRASWVKRSDAQADKSRVANGANPNAGRYPASKRQSIVAESPKVNTSPRQRDSDTHTPRAAHAPRHHSSKYSSSLNTSTGPVVSSARIEGSCGRTDEDKNPVASALPMDPKHPSYSLEWPELNSTKNTTSTCDRDNGKMGKNVSTENSLKTHSDDNHSHSATARKGHWYKMGTADIHSTGNTKKYHASDNIHAQGRRSEGKHRNAQGAKSARKSSSLSEPASKSGDPHGADAVQRNSLCRPTEDSEKSARRHQKGADSCEKGQQRKSSGDDSGIGHTSIKLTAVQRDRGAADAPHSDVLPQTENPVGGNHTDSPSNQTPRHKPRNAESDQEYADDQKVPSAGVSVTGSKHSGTRGRGNQNPGSAHGQHVNSKYKGANAGWNRGKKGQRRTDYVQYSGNTRDNFLDTMQHRYVAASPEVAPQANNRNRYQLYRTVPYINVYNNRQIYAQYQYLLSTAGFGMIDFEKIKYWICLQVEYYFSIDNLCKDVYIKNNMDPGDGSVPLDCISKFNRMKSLISMAVSRASAALPPYPIINNDANTSEAERQDQYDNFQKSHQADPVEQPADASARFESTRCQDVGSAKWVQSLIVSSLTSSQTVEVIFKDDGRSVHLRPASGWEQWVIVQPTREAPNPQNEAIASPTEQSEEKDSFA